MTAASQPWYPPGLTCTDCTSTQYTVTSQVSDDGKWIHFARLCAECRESRRLREVTSAATCGANDVDANGSPAQETPITAVQSNLRVEAAAVCYEDIVYSLPPPARHHDVMRMAQEKLGIDSMYIGPDGFGFVLSDGRYVRRAPAMLIAVKAGQFNRRPGGYQGPDLYSEDVW